MIPAEVLVPQKPNSERLTKVTTMRLNHHSSQIYPYYQHSLNELILILEQKDAGFMPQAGFQSGENALGGNYDPSKNSEDLSPVDTLDRELREEFWMSEEPADSLAELLGANIAGTEGSVKTNLPDKATIHKIRAMGELLRSGPEYVGSVKTNFPDDFLKKGRPALNVGQSLFTKRLTHGEFIFIQELIGDLNGKLTPDNYRFGSRVSIISPQEIDGTNIRSAYGNHLVLYWLFNHGKLHGKKPTQPAGPITVETLDYSLITDLTPSGCPTYAGIINIGYSFEK